ncbi:helix-turn-helix transcriptional regulator, partial [Bifidobacterium longum]
MKGLTQADLSERTGLSRPWINQFEQGKIENASIGRILTLCNALG